MSDAAFFEQLIRRVRAGDGEAARALWESHEPQLRLEVSLRLRDPRLRRGVNASDICQSVMLSFFVRLRLGQFDVDKPGDLVHLLATMARNKVAEEARRQRASRRDVGRIEPIAADDCGIADKNQTPSQILSAEEMVREARARLTEEERILVDLRAEGRPWAEIADRLGGTLDARRIQFARAVPRVSNQLGLEVDDGG